MNYNTQTKSQTNLLYSFKFWFLTLFLILIYSVVLIGQNVVYIDPSNSGDPIQDGSVDHPFDNWEDDVSWQDNTTYLQKRGTQITNSEWLRIEGKYGVTIGAYGEGPKPIIQCFAHFNVIDVASSSHTVIRDLELSGIISNTVAGVGISGHWQANGTFAHNTKIINCDIHDTYNGIRALSYETNCDTVLVSGCTIYNSMSDGIYNSDADSITVVNTHIYKVNMGFHLMEGGHSQTVSAGDCIQLGKGVHSFTVRNCILDRRFTGNKFCFIYNTNGIITDGVGLLEGNTFYMPKDTIGDDGGAGLYIL